MIQNFYDFFKSFYYSCTYVPPVDLSDHGLARHLLKDRKQAKIVQQLMSRPMVQKIISEPLTYDHSEVSILKDQGFTLLSSKFNLQKGKELPFYSTMEHNELLPEWIIKSGVTQGQLGLMNDLSERAILTDKENILRIEMANRIQEVASKKNIRVVIPNQKLVACTSSVNPNKKYCVVSKKIDVLDVNKTVEAIKNMDAKHQKAIAKTISILVQKIGIVNTSFNNIRLTYKNNQLVFINTKPASLMVEKKPGLWNKLFHPKGASVEKCARIGLYTLMCKTSKIPGLESFTKEIQAHYEKAVHPKLSQWKIALSIVSLGIIPIINLIRAVVKLQLAKRTWEKLQIINVTFFEPSSRKDLLVRQNLMAKDEEPQEKWKLLENQFYAYIEGVPHNKTA